ncbi:recombination mediator RecR [Treponema sp. Marseille-Q3903]|uniref:recombination mediator RecR n=1 Tax=Treponema sp. Marseille-Q3903 TaxID=2766703 RepID=UPI001651B189|nr:recombination mediator RecR [Treponema sp. Marseille-Q3903]MBC6712531.1 recombination protein RecR [Treponema sp. Marseille-Q3903]
MNAFEELSNNFSRLPGIGKKSAVRMVNWLLRQDPAFIQRFAQNLGTLQERIKHCSVCGTWTESDPCPICSNPIRDKTQICVVEQPQDVSTIEAHGEYKGLYHVLGGLIKPLEGIGPAQLAIQPLLNRIKDGAITEIIIATNPTVEGDTTALYINKVITELNLSSSPKVTRLATGIPVGGDLEYIDKRTLSLSFRGRSCM